MLNQLYRLGVGVVGSIMMLAGLIMIPLPIPGPGWVTLFLGLAVLSTEFAWAHRATSFIRHQLHRAGTLGQHLTVRARTFLHEQHAYHRHTMLAHARSAYQQFSPLPIPA